MQGNKNIYQNKYSWPMAELPNETERVERALETYRQTVITCAYEEYPNWVLAINEALNDAYKTKNLEKFEPWVSKVYEILNAEIK